MSLRRSAFGASLVAAGLAGSALMACGGNAAAPPPAAGRAPSAASPAAAAAPAREAPPSPLASREAPFPAVTRSALANGLELSVVEAHALPVVQLRVLVRAGTGYGLPGVAPLTARLLKDGGTRGKTSAELMRRIETLGASLGVDASLDGTVLTLGIVKGQLDEALSLLAEVVREPRFDEAELTKLKARETDEAEDNARSNGTWAAYRVGLRALFDGKGPYATYGLSPSEIAKVNGAAVRDFHRRFYVPQNTSVVIAGDVTDADARRATEHAFGSWSLGSQTAAPAPTVPATKPLTFRRVIVSHRPKSAQSDVFVMGFAPPRQIADWPTLRVAVQVLGGGATGRLFTDVREQRSLAYSASAQVLELARGDEPLIAYAGTRTPKTAAAVQGVLENFAQIASAKVTDAETATARRFLSDIFAVRMETIGSIADMVVTARKLGLEDPKEGGSYWDAYRAAVKKVDAEQASAFAARLFHPDRTLVVVSGDADVIAEPLARFGEVTVVDPEHEFKTLRTLPKNEAAPVDPAAPPTAGAPPISPTSLPATVPAGAPASTPPGASR